MYTRHSMSIGMLKRHGKNSNLVKKLTMCPPYTGPLTGTPALPMHRPKMKRSARPSPTKCAAGAQKMEKTGRKSTLRVTVFGRKRKLKNRITKPKNSPRPYRGVGAYLHILAGRK